MNDSQDNSPHQAGTSAELREALLDWCTAQRHSGDPYFPTRFGPAVRDRDGAGVVVFCSDLIVTAPAEGATGFRRMIELGRGDETLEAIVLRPRWRALFSPAVREVAAWRLGQHAIPIPHA